MKHFKPTFGSIVLSLEVIRSNIYISDRLGQMVNPDQMTGGYI